MFCLPKTAWPPTSYRVRAPGGLTGGCGPFWIRWVVVHGRLWLVGRSVGSIPVTSESSAEPGEGSGALPERGGSLLRRPRAGSGGPRAPERGPAARPRGPEGRPGTPVGVNWRKREATTGL